VTPVTVNRKYVWTSGSAPPSTRSAVEVPNAVVGLTSVTSASATGVKVMEAAFAGSATTITTAAAARLIAHASRRRKRVALRARADRGSARRLLGTPRSTGRSLPFARRLRHPS